MQEEERGVGGGARGHVYDPPAIRQSQERQGGQGEAGGPGGPGQHTTLYNCLDNAI